MKTYCTIFFTVFFVSACLKGNSQTPVPLASLPNYVYTENFADINNWVFNSTPNGTFVSGAGSAPWRGVTAGGSGTIPNGSRVTTSGTTFVTMGSSGIQRGNESLVLLSTGTTDNTSATAIDLYIDFTGLTANTLSFDWATINNSTGNRNGSLHVYASVDGISFEEIAAAQVLNFTNNVISAGNIANVHLPATLNNSSFARLRFYYNNGTGGTTGSRPKISIDNVKVTGVSTSPCATPAAQPTALSFAAITDTSISASFNPPSPAPNGYLVVMSNNPSLSANPVNGTTYNTGDNLGDGNVIAVPAGNSFSVTGLTPATNYYFFIFSMNLLCTGGPLYLNASPLTGNSSTLAGFQPCTTPVAQPNSLIFNNTSINSIRASFDSTGTKADEFLVVRSVSSTLSAIPVNGTSYSPGEAFGGGTVVSRNAATSFIANGLSPQTTYYFFVFALNGRNCYNGPNYLTNSPLTANKTTNPLPPCATPPVQPNSLKITASNTTLNGSFTSATGADSYLVLYSLSSSLSTLPQDGSSYTAGGTLGNAIIAQSSGATGFILNNLTASTQYYFYVFAQNSNCSAGPKYLPGSPLSGSVVTTSLPTYNYYYGNLHAHSYYSDGNQDNPSFTPANDYAYAKNSLCMDFLGISEHNHAGAGMSINNWQPGLAQAASATSPNFLAMYGMEWGIISGGGHVLVYGVSKLLGWETNNYDVYVPRNSYTTLPNGLFRTINSFGPRAFGVLAHPNFNDYNNIANLQVNLTADSAIVGSAVESGPAFSTSTNYNDRPFSMAYLEYFNTMLARGYHIGPTIDHDNHNTTFGRTAYSRLAVLAPSLDTASFYEAMKARHFYASEDCDTRVSFNLNAQLMGSVFTGNSEPAITIYANDPTSPGAVPKIRLMMGVPGSTLLPVPVDSVFANTFTYTDYSLPNMSTAYYYADITINGARTITSPIWYTRDNNFVLPVNLLSFKATATGSRTVNLSWSTSSEMNNDFFELERSADGRNFTTIHTEKGRTNKSHLNVYGWTDILPFDGINYYRLRQVDIDGRVSYSPVVSVNFRAGDINSFTVLPNPVQSHMQLNIHSKLNQTAEIRISDVAGKSISMYKRNLVKGSQLLTANLKGVRSGTYLITIVIDNEVFTRKFVKL